MNSVKVLKTPIIPISNESFVYNFYVSNESDVDDRKFIVFEDEERSYAIRTTDARELTPPRYIRFSINTEEIKHFNSFELSNNVNTLVNGQQSVLDGLNELQNLGKSPDNLFTLEKRKEYLNDINFLIKEQNSDTEIDLTLLEDAGEPYNQLVRFYDEENPEDIININDDYILYANSTYDLDYTKQFKQHQKNGDHVIINSNYFNRIKNSNRRLTNSYLEDKQDESKVNRAGNNYRNDILTSLERSYIQAPSLDLNYNFDFNFDNIEINIDQRLLDAALNRSESIESQIFNVKPKIFKETTDYLESTTTDYNPVTNGFSLGFRTLKDFVVGILIDKFYLNEENEKIYLCSSFFTTLESLKAKSLEIIDRAVKYNRTYIYEARPVLLKSDVKNTEIPKRINILVLGRRTSSFAIKCIERESPNPPAFLELEYDLNKKGILLKWGLPRNRQRDIVNFQIFKRESPFEPFKLIKEYRKIDVDVVNDTGVGVETPTESLIEHTKYLKFNFLDDKIENNKIYIYAVCCVDAHGIASAYSAQVAGRFNKLTSNLEVDAISLQGALKQYPNQFFPRKTKFYDFENDVIANTPIINNKSKMNIYFTPDYKNIIKGSKNISIFKTDSGENLFSFSLTNTNTLESTQQNIFINNRG